MVFYVRRTLQKAQAVLRQESVLIEQRKKSSSRRSALRACERPTEKNAAAQQGCSVDRTEENNVARKRKEDADAEGIEALLNDKRVADEHGDDQQACVLPAFDDDNRKDQECAGTSAGEEGRSQAVEDWLWEGSPYSGGQLKPLRGKRLFGRGYLAPGAAARLVNDMRRVGTVPPKRKKRRQRTLSSFGPGTIRDHYPERDDKDEDRRCHEDRREEWHANVEYGRTLR